ncbi:UDP-N-acetylmuramate dehydrogenase [Mycolicibacterium komossense]|uniref:UDP-N-acetylenolpyruvoylglucosamine reductase n=1 Tax=Mycolicibacterium komossense TaxID=1779 RepID=A0ABT3CLF8_9MYCO|nr:UDP-N-acetylmuramate dehydrogenase [Mycolicibacterium komossense]MCV7230269.1 UDP-N-acetylmuramate dehydrogenase [Mycolicibacterium komossense]
MAGSQFAGAAVTEEVPLAPLTSLRVGPVAQRVITCVSTEQIVAAVCELDAVGGRPLILAGGSNVVLADDLADLTVVRLASPGITVDGNVIRAEAGAVWDDVVSASLAAGLGGLECLSGIPGSAGATPVQNVGAYGAEVADTISRVRLLDRRTGEVRWVPGPALEFGYRTSVLKHSGDAIALEVEFALDDSGRSAPLRYGELTAALEARPGDRAEAVAVREAVLALRRHKAMVLDPPDHDTWSVGSFFTNPVVSPQVYADLAARTAGPVPHYPAGTQVKLAAGWLVEHAGFGKGFPGEGAPARLSTRHALALTNRGTATSADVIGLARRVRDGVRDAFGIVLTPEPVLVGCVI